MQSLSSGSFLFKLSHWQFEWIWPRESPFSCFINLLPHYYRHQEVQATTDISHSKKQRNTTSKSKGNCRVCSLIHVHLVERVTNNTPHPLSTVCTMVEICRFCVQHKQASLNGNRQFPPSVNTMLLSNQSEYPLNFISHWLTWSWWLPSV